MTIKIPRPAGFANVFAAAAWAGVVFGIAEGQVLNVTRQFPAIVAPYKTSAHVIWIAPLLDILLFLVVALILIALFRLAPRMERRADIATTAVFTFIGLFGVLTAPKLLHPLAAAILAAGGAASACRASQRHEGLLTKLRHSVALIPLMIGSLAAGTAGALRVEGSARAERIPVNGTFNVLLVVLDTVRRDHFWWAGGTSYTPNIDRFTERGVRYDDAWSVSSWSLPAQASILTGEYPEEHHADWPSLRLSRDVPTLAAYFSQRGYDTGAFSSNSSWITPEYVGRGFQRFDAYTFEDHLRRTAYGRVLSRLSNLVGLHYSGRGKPASEVNDELLGFLGERRTKPFFAFVCYMDVNRTFHHRQLNHPFWAKDPPVSEQVGAYREGLRKLDVDFGDLLAELQRRNLMQNTIVVITSDHGESFGAGNAADRNPKGHGTSLFPEQTRVPLFVVFPQRVREPRIVTGTVSVRAIPATIALLSGDASAPFRGPPLPGVESYSTASAEEAALATLHYGEKYAASVALGGWQYVREVRDGRSAEHLIDVSPAPAKHVAIGEFESPPSLASMRIRLSKMLREARQGPRNHPAAH